MYIKLNREPLCNLTGDIQINRNVNKKKRMNDYILNNLRNGFGRVPLLKCLNN